MRWIGLTGGIGTGKSTVSELFRSKGVPVADADQIAHQLVQPGKPGLKAVLQLFGNKVLKSDGSLDRKKLGQLVFQDKKALLQLEAILHPLVKEQVQKLRDDFAKQGHIFAVYDVPLLFEKNLQDQFDKIVLVYADPQVQFERILKRDHLSKDEINKRLNAQIPQDEKKQKADFVIDNSKSRDDLAKNFEKVYQVLQSGKL